ncbi:MAG: glycosyltransferase [Pseudoclavibacter sp.]|nr:glycosyltransferase [Pseudoclavibacter sp.]
MTRIGYVLKVYPRFSETFIVTELLAREAHGDDIGIYALKPTGDSRFHPEIARVKARVSWVPRPANNLEMWEQMSRPLTHPRIQERFWEVLPFIRELPGFEAAQGLALARAVLDDGIDHLHAHFASLAGRMAWIASRLTGVPYTVTTHAKDIFHESVDREWLRRVCGDARQVVAISRFNEEYLREVLDGTGAQLRLQYNALELDRFPYREPQTPGSPLRIAAVGRLVPKKGFADLIDAIAQLTAAGREVTAEIAGDGELRGRLQERIDRAGLQGRVRLVGPCTQAEVRELMARSHVFVVPSVPAADGNVDGLPTVALEAMAVGIPVVGTDVSGLPEVIRDAETGVLLPPGDPAALARALSQIMDGRIDVRPLAAGARRLVEERFDSRVQAATLSAWQRDGGEG